MRDLSELLKELRYEPAYPECCEQAADEIERLTRQLAEAREALLALVQCPCISERDMEPAWRCTETDEAERRARAVLARLDAEEPKP